MSSHFTTVAIWGVGLIGGSIGMALRQRGLVGEVIGIGRASRAAAGALPEAVRLGAVDRMVTDPAEALAEADLVMLAMPVQARVAAARAGYNCLNDTLTSSILRVADNLRPARLGRPESGTAARRASRKNDARRLRPAVEVRPAAATRPRIPSARPASR